MGINILIVDTPADIVHKLAFLFIDRCYWFDILNNELMVIEKHMTISDTTTYSKLSEDELATLEFLPDFDTRYTYLLSLSLGINA